MRKGKTFWWYRLSFLCGAVWVSIWPNIESKLNTATHIHTPEEKQTLNWQHNEEKLYIEI